MTYVILYISWNAGMYANQVNYVIPEFSAIKLDEKMHTVDTFRFLKEIQNSYVQSEQHFEKDKVFVAEFLEGWNAFRDWLDVSSMLVVWDDNAVRMLEYAGKTGGLANKKINLSELYLHMTKALGKRNVSLKSIPMWNYSK